MKKLRLIIPVLLICFLLNGCGFLFPFFFLNFLDPAEQSSVQELPVGSDVAETLSAEDIYYRSKFAAKERATKFNENAAIQLSFSEDGWDSLYDVHYDTSVTLDSDSCAVNELLSLSFYEEEPDIYQTYYRNEDGRLICYSYDEATREEIPLEGLSPYAIIVDYTVYGYPAAPYNLSVAPQTRILNDREVYVLAYEQSALYTFGSVGNTVKDEKLNKIMIPATWYVDAQTYLPVQRVFTITRMDDLLCEVISSIYQISEAELDAIISGLSVTTEFLSFDPVEVPPVPDEVLKKAWDDSGFAAQ